MMKSTVMNLSDPTAFERAYDEHARGVYRAAYRVLGSAAQAQDVVQDVFLKLWREPGKFDARRGELGSYLRLMARSRALDLWREGQAAGRASDRLKLDVALDEGRADERPAVAAEREGRVAHAARRPARAARGPARGGRARLLGRPDGRPDRAALERPARHGEEPHPPGPGAPAPRLRGRRAPGSSRPSL